MKLPPYVALGQVNVGSLHTVAWLTPIALFGAWAGYQLTKVVPEKLFFQLIEAALLILSLILLKDSLPKVWMLLYS